MRFATAALAITATIAMSASASAQRASGAENGLVGIKLYDAGLRVIQVYGTPDDIQGINIGGGQQAGGPGMGGRGGPGPGGPGFGPGGPGPMGPGGGGGGAMPAAMGTGPDPFGFANEMLRQGISEGDDLGGPIGGPQRPGGGPPGSSGGFGPGRPGAPGPGGMAPGGMGPGGGAGPTGAQGDRITFTRWVYRRGGSRYGFVIDNQNRVVQIEAIGLMNNKVRTKRGLGFGATFADVVKKYRDPESYDISGETILVRFLLKNKVAFRLNRLGENKPHVVTGIVVAAGKGA